ncbi:MAG: sulfite exporter TauE/SafE family protein [Kofleriaceae bacterium]
MTTSLLAVVAASLVGSVHCVAMCGPLAALHLPADGRGGLRLGSLHALGRMLTYLALGITAGALGRALELAGELASIQRAATTIAGAAILAWGVIAIARAVGARRQRVATRTTLFERGLVRLRVRRPGRRAVALGVLTGLLPCGWLWAFVVVAAGSASAVGGALVMLAFWLGTVPAMLGLTTIAAPLVRRLRARLPIVTATALVVLGVVTLAGRWQVAGDAGVTKPTCHHHGGAP